MHARANTRARARTHTHTQHGDFVSLFSLFRQECRLKNTAHLTKPKIKNTYVDNPSYAVWVCVCLCLCMCVHTYTHRHISLPSPLHFSLSSLSFNFLCLNTENSTSLHNKLQKMFKPAPEWSPTSHKFHQSLATLLGKLWCEHVVLNATRNVTSTVSGIERIYISPVLHKWNLHMWTWSVSNVW